MTPDTTSLPRTSRNIGGSILPSNCAMILQPVETPVGTLQVRVMEAQDTHGLFRVSDGALLAQHPNGYSCHALAKRLATGGKAAEQADYIVACGGTVTEECRAILAGAAQLAA